MWKASIAFIATASVIAFAPAAHADNGHAHSYDCVDAGQHVCAPDNPRHVPAGCYDDGGVLEFAWPCPPWTPADGYIHGDGSITYPDGPCDPGPDSDQPCTLAQANAS